MSNKFDFKVKEIGINELESQLLDDLEHATNRIHHHTLKVNKEVSTQNKLLNSMDMNATDGTEALLAQAKNIESSSKTSEGFCWMYSVIAVESAILVLLLYIGTL